MELQELRALLVFVMMVFIIETWLLIAVIFFSQLPFFLAVITVALRMFVFFLVMFVAAFLVFTVSGIRPELTLEWWIAHVKEYLRTFGGSVLLTAMLITLSICFGTAFALLLERIFLSSTFQGLRQWVAIHIH